jgi:hypothetical protein
MKRLLPLLGVLALLGAGCGSAKHALVADHPVRIASDEPPAPSTWPDYPDFDARHSCWARNALGGGVMRAAPSTAAVRPATPAAIARSVLRGLGDHRYVHRIELGPVPPKVLAHLKGWFGGERPPRDALWAYIAAPATINEPGPHPSPAQVQALSAAEWEVELVKGALRDRFCAAAGRPLVGFSVSGLPGGVSDREQAFGQRFPNPGVAAFRRRLALVGRRYGFRVSSLRLLRPLQVAPLVVVSTDRGRTDFAKDVPVIARLLDPLRTGDGLAATTFEGFMLVAEDAKGPFVSVENAYRGEVMGGEWAWDRCWYPYPHSEPLRIPKPKPCPPGSTSG